MILFFFIIYILFFQLTQNHRIFFSSFFPSVGSCAVLLIMDMNLGKEGKKRRKKKVQNIHPTLLIL